MESAAWHSTKSDLAYAVIRNRILSNEYAPGTTIKQVQLAKEIGISTTPLREALRRLKQEGLVELDAHRDAHIAALTTEEAADLLELRLALDPMAASLAAQRRTRQDIDEMRASRIPALPDAPSMVDLDAHRRFHRSIYAASHNSMLITTLDGLWDKADRYRMVGLQQGREQIERDETEREHEAIMSAVIAGDAEAAASIMRTHINRSLGAKAATLPDTDAAQPAPAPRRKEAE